MANVRKQLVTKLSFLLLVATLLLPGAAWAQNRIFLGASVGFQVPADGEFVQSAEYPFRAETATARADYGVATGPMVDAGAGYMINKWLGAGIAFHRFSSSDTADYLLTLPHPVEFNQAVTKTGVTEELDHAQRGLHLSAVIAPLQNSGLDLKFFVGPSRLYVNQALVEGFDVTETLAPFDFTVDRAIVGDKDDACACAWGFHVGADVTKSLNDTIGIGAMLRYTRATVDLKDAVQSAAQDQLVTQEYTAGGFMLGFGLRVGFGGGDGGS